MLSADALERQEKTKNIYRKQLYSSHAKSETIGRVIESQEMPGESPAFVTGKKLLHPKHQ